ncbi:hypothetical protein DHW03_04280 [Pedobacter yonginense]|uniref:Uncharacterized protein n=1 Tax=Pedobacter yonginense TaxID=651869 RepID=A0A317EV46_9SPHI|nr:DUF5655 domain-containing protein [Pedobacter yonginense]PWS29058.1 hypothetical protein DHW03_04280 [Pedobacter yonginense]
MQNQEINHFLEGKTEYALSLFRFFVDTLNGIGTIKLVPLKTMIAIAGRHQFAYITQVGKNFIHLVIPFPQPFDDNFCFTKIVQVAGTPQYNHHLRIYFEEDLNDEVKDFLRLAYNKVDAAE